MLIESLVSDQDPYFEVIMDNDQTSHPSSPTTVHQDLVDDVWGSDNDDDSTILSNDVSSADRTDPSIRSDIPRLRSIHVTAGYRDGISSAKEASVQEGFDEGFAFGAEVGMAAGWILGILKGMERRVSRKRSPGSRDGRLARISSSGLGDVPLVKIGVEFEAADTMTVGKEPQTEHGGFGGEGNSSHDRDTSEPLSDILSQLRDLAEQELSLKSLFSADYLDSDGIWKYEVPSLLPEGEKQEDHEIAFREVALAHPLVSKWTEVTRRLMMATVDKAEN